MSNAEITWAEPPRRLAMERDGLHLWLVPLAPPVADLELLEEVLSAEEGQRCRRFIRPKDRSRSIVARAALRMILGAYLHECPEALSLATDPSGKPYLEPAVLQFNLSHAEDLAVVAVCRERRVGVDIERRHEVAEMEAILLRFFSEAERNFVDLQEGDERIRAFFLLWTRREAAAKALGLDLMDSFDRLSLPPIPPSPVGFRLTLPESAEDRSGLGSWWMRDLCPASGYAGALCVEGGEAALRSWRFNPATLPEA